MEECVDKEESQVQRLGVAVARRFAPRDLLADYDLAVPLADLVGEDVGRVAFPAQGPVEPPRDRRRNEGERKLPAREYRAGDLLIAGRHHL